MISSQPITRTTVAPERLAEAGVWIARLHGGSRGRGMENGLRRWLQADAENARAFELATEVWEDAEQLRRFVSPGPTQRMSSRPRWNGLLAAAAAMVMMVAGFAWFQQRGVITTDVGEQRQLVLEDGTRVFLNTNSKVVVKYDEQTRRVELQRGEALFDVAKRADWPFIVVAGARQVRALGTSFVVRSEEQSLAVTLVEGKVTVSPQSEPAAAQVRKDTFTLAPGQRVTFSSGAAATFDTPSLQTVMAWRRGQVILDDTPLRVAAEEMNRYNTTQLVIEGAAAAALPINGLFQTGDSLRFANAVAQAYGLNVSRRGNQIVISAQ